MKRSWTRLLLVAGVMLQFACANVNEASSRNATADLGLEQVSTRNMGASEHVFNAYITGYSYWDNTPRGSVAIARPVIHRGAGGVGTYSDPITIAVGHVIVGGRQTLDYPEGTRFYLSNLRRYAIVEDVCGDGNRPQDGPCHSGHRGNPWLDIYIDGRRAGEQASIQCAYSLTGIQEIIMNPQDGYPVVAGALTESGCQSYPS